jgi:hypothetical protein
MAMRRAWGVCLISLSVLAVVPGRAAAAAPTFATTTVYAKCLDGAKVQNAATAAGQVVTWTKQRPYNNFVSIAAAGCWYTDDDALSTVPLTWRGTVKGWR